MTYALLLLNLFWEFLKIGRIRRGWWNGHSAVPV